MNNPLMGMIQQQNGGNQQPNAFQMISQAVKQGITPNMIAQQLIQNNPAVRQAAQIMRGRTPEQIKNMAYSRAQEMGVDLNAMAKQWGIKLPD